MITINYNGKTYTTKEYTQGDTIIGAHVRNWIKKGFLEEVKENKELMEDDTLESIKEFEEYEQSIKDTSILEKLREELERREKEHRDCENELSEFSLGVWQAECEILALLTSPEQSENNLK